MTIAWRKVADVPRDDPRPWLFATARNLLLAERRHRLALTEASPGHRREDDTVAQPAPEACALDPEIVAALRSLSRRLRSAATRCLGRPLVQPRRAIARN